MLCAHSRRAKLARPALSLHAYCDLNTQHVLLHRTTRDMLAVCTGRVVYGTIRLRVVDTFMTARPSSFIVFLEYTNHDSGLRKGRGLGRASVYSV